MVRRHSLRIVISVLVLLGTVGTLLAHDLFLKLDTYFVAPGTSLVVRVLNGTFTESEGAVARNRVRDIRVMAPAGLTQLDTTTHGRLRATPAS
jgi:hypothetical protein